MTTSVVAPHWTATSLPSACRNTASPEKRPRRNASHHSPAVNSGPSASTSAIGRRTSSGRPRPTSRTNAPFTSTTRRWSSTRTIALRDCPKALANSAGQPVSGAIPTALRPEAARPSPEVDDGAAHGGSGSTFARTSFEMVAVVAQVSGPASMRTQSSGKPCEYDQPVGSGGMTVTGMSSAWMLFGRLCRCQCA